MGDFLRHTGFAAALAVLVAAIAAIASCAPSSGSGSLRAQGRGVATSGTLATRFTTVVYGEGDDTVASFYLTDLPVDQLLDGEVGRGQVVHIELFWIPMPGKTPLDASATNISVRHIVLLENQIGIYGGAGYGRLAGDVGDNTVSLAVSNASLALLDRTAGFADPITPGALNGTLKAVYDPALARRLGLAVSQVATNRLGRPRYVSR